MSAIEKGQIVIYAAYILVFAATFFLARMLLREQESLAAQENLADQRDRKASSGLVRITRPFFTQYVAPMIRGKPFWDAQRLQYRRKLIASGLKEELTPDEFIAFKAFLVFFFPFVLGLLNALDLVEVSGWIIVGSGGLGWFYPDLWIRSRMQARQHEILYSMPFIVDLLALSTEAGLDFIGAIGRVVEKAKPGPLVEELGQLLREIRLGTARQDALREMGARIDMTEMNSFVAILISADQMGASIGKILRQQSEQIRSQRVLAAEKAGAQAATKIFLPIMLCIVPSVFLMIFGPLILSIVYPSG